MSLLICSGRGAGAAPPPAHAGPRRAAHGQNRRLRGVQKRHARAVDRFVPAFNFLIWAGKSPEEAMDAAMFETDGEA